jgi:hypothetical protein
MLNGNSSNPLRCRLSVVQREDEAQDIFGGPGGAEYKDELVQDGKAIETLGTVLEEGSYQGKAHIGNLSEGAAHGLAGALALFMASASDAGCQGLLAVIGNSVFSHICRHKHLLQSSSGLHPEYPLSGVERKEAISSICEALQIFNGL